MPTGGFVPADTAQRKETGLGGGSGGDGIGLVVLFDQCAPRRQQIGPIVADCGGTAYFVEGLIKGNPGNWPTSGRILMVALEAEPDPSSSVLPAIRAFRQRGFMIVAFADGLERWALRSRCLVLLAGASHLLDSATQGFDGQLRRLLSQLLGDETARRTEDCRTRDAMTRLGVVGPSQAMLAVFRCIARISTLSDLPALLTGETGTGKELLAHAIHALDPKRCKGPFIAVNCAALSPTLAESELFGHRRGTFTGAERDRKGLIRAAHGGVLFLDEIGDLGMDLQPKLLRVLQENMVLTLGEEQEVSVSVRVVAATNQDLRELTVQRRFRADLFQRLNVLPVRVPSLRERQSDVEPLVQHFLAKHRALHPGEHLETAPEFFEALATLELPGNVRQLENLVRQVLVNRKTGMPLTLSDLPPEIWLQLCKRETACPLQEAQSHKPNHDHPIIVSELGTDDLAVWESLLHDHGGNLVSCLRACERSLLGAVLRRAHGNQSQMARVLGITARSVYSKIRKYDLQP